jgi:vacuolar-type H+-ATPase subunit F/Vma7
VSRLLVLTTHELAAGYRLAGVTVFEAASSADAATQLEKFLDQENGVIAVHAPFFHEFARPLRRRLDASRTPLVVALPAGMTDDQVRDRRTRLLRMLRQAVGYEITFNDETRTP